MTVADMLNGMSAKEFTEWMAYYELEPFGPVRDDQRAGEVASVLANVHRDSKKRPTPFSAVDFFPNLSPDYRTEILEDDDTKIEIREPITNKTAGDKLRSFFAPPANFRKSKDK